MVLLDAVSFRPFPLSSWPGEVRAIQSAERVVKIVPVGIASLDQDELLFAGPMLDALLSVNGISDVVVPFYVDQTLQPVLFGEPVDQRLPMLPGTAAHVARAIF